MLDSYRPATGARPLLKTEMQQQLGQITWQHGPVAGAPPCPACGSQEQKPAVLETANAIQRRDPTPLHLVACETCRTRYWTDLAGFHYEEPAPHPWATRFYVEQGASVDGLIEPIARLPAGSVKSCLEIGCGFGFSLDAGRVLFGWRTVGVDPSPLAAAGRDALDIDIRPIYADADTELGGPFDLVYGSEVIEHVATPHDFLRICRAHLAPGGVLILTTPDGDSIHPDVPASALMPILSPGHHLVLFNRDSLQNVARAAGFAFTQIVPREYGLVLYASDRPIAIDTSAALDRAPFRTYLSGVLERPGRPAELRTGLRYRLFKELVNVGDYAAALTVFEDIQADCRKRFGLTLSPATAAEHDRAVRSGNFDVPFCLPGLLYFRGMVALNASPAPGDAAAWFDAAAVAATAFRAAYQAVGIDDGETGAIERSAPELALLALCHGDPVTAASRLRQQQDPAQTLVNTLAMTLLDLGHLGPAGEVAALSDDPAVPAMVAGWDHLLRSENAQAHAALAEAGRSDGPIGLRARSADMLALASLDPDAAVLMGRDLASDTVPLDGLFNRLVDLGHLRQAASIESAIDRDEGWPVLGRRGVLALLHSKDPVFAAELFERAFAKAAGHASGDELWRLKYHELLALIGAADAVAARRAAQEILAAGDQVPPDLRDTVDALLTKHPAARPKTA